MEKRKHSYDEVNKFVKLYEIDLKPTQKQGKSSRNIH